MIEKSLPDLLTLSTTFYDVSVLCNRFLKAQKAQIWAGGNAGVKKQGVKQYLKKTNLVQWEQKD